MSTSAQPAPSPQILLFARAVLSILSSWPALTIAVKEQWGGPESADKRTWLASTLIDEFESRAQFLPGTSPPMVDPKSDHPLDFDEIADLLHQVMSDEFDANIEDESIELVAKDLGRVWGLIVEGKGEEAVEELEKRAEEREKKGVMATKGQGPATEEGDEDSDSESGSEEDDDGMDVDEAPQLVPRERMEKVVDEDGFELVQKGRRK